MTPLPKRMKTGRIVRVNINRIFAVIMGKEIERKFLVKDLSFIDISVRRHHIEQGYLSCDPSSTVRVRIKDDKGYLTIKGITDGSARSEWEYEIPVADAREILEECATESLSKERYIIPAADGLVWEVDVFHKRLEGLIIAEIELPHEDFPISVPAFIGTEVTGDPRFYNSNLIKLRSPEGLI